MILQDKLIVIDHTPMYWSRTADYLMDDYATKIKCARLFVRS